MTEIIENKFHECPFCGCGDINSCAFSISPDCYAECSNCGAMIEIAVSWNGMTHEEHDQACIKALLPLWNRRSGVRA